MEKMRAQGRLRMKGEFVIVFVDALPYKERERLKVVERYFQFVRPLQPGFGYSVNVKSEIFAGLRPDDAGFLNEWTYQKDNGYQWLRFPPSLYYFLSNIRIVKRGLSKVFSYLVGEDLRNIPLPLLPSLLRIGINAYDDAHVGSNLFKRNEIQRYLYSVYGSDLAAYEALCQKIKTSSKKKTIRAFLAMAELDHIMHRDGKRSLSYQDYITSLDIRLRYIWGLLQNRSNDAWLCLISDHGMASVHHTVRFDIERHFPSAGERYGYFVDATMARLWAGNIYLLNQINEWLITSGLPGRLLTMEDRHQWGITSKAFGDIIFLLDEGFMFVPNFIGDRPAKAMHGYWPLLESQQGIFASTIPIRDLSNEGPIKAFKAYDILDKLCVS